METEMIHSPNLRTILMVEHALKTANLAVTREELKRMLPTQVMHQTLNVILAYLEQDGKIWDSRKGIIWTRNDNPEFQKMMREGVELSSWLAQRREDRMKNPSRN